MGRALEGIRVLDLASYIAGPYCCMLLADHGAEVIRAEPPGGKVDRQMGPFTPEGEPVTYGMVIQHNKKNITLNLRSERGQKLLEELVKNIDVLVHNNPKGTEEAEILAYDRLSAINPRLVVAAVSGFGQNGPYAERLCFDAVAQAMSGVMGITGYPGTPPLKCGVPFIDFSTAANTALGVMLALFERNRSGRGQLVDMALFDVAFSMIAAMGCAAEYKLLGEIRKPVGNCAFYAYVGSCKAKDGYVSINILGNSMWKRTCEVIGRKDMIKDPRFKDNESRYRNYPDIDVVLNDWCGDKTVAEILKILEDSRIPSGPVNDIPAALQVEQVAAREMLVELEVPGTGKVPVPGVSIKLSRTPGRIDKRASFVGEDNEDIYGRLLGYKKEDIQKLKAEKAI